jgi:hypothetical protein
MDVSGIDTAVGYLHLLHLPFLGEQACEKHRHSQYHGDLVAG